MQKALLSTCLLLALLSPVTSLTCSYCNSKETSCIEETTEVCDSTTTCITGVLDNNIFTKYKTKTYRGCTRSEGCRSGDYSISTANGKYIQMKTGCCGVDHCNKEPRCVIPRKDFPPNGLECPSCFGLVDLGLNPKCENQGTVKCLGNETKCIELSSGVTGTNFMQKIKLKGCATEDVCSLNKKIFYFRGLDLRGIATQCSDAKKSSKKADSQ